MIILRCFFASSLLLMSCAAHSTTILPLFVARIGQLELDTLHLVEAPAGHLTGTLVVVTFGPNGLQKQDVVCNVTGSVYQGGVSLQIDQGILEHPQNLVGTLQGELLTVSYGNSTEVFHSMSQRAYQQVFASVSQAAENQHKTWLSDQAVANDNALFAQLTKDLQQYMDWANERIQRVQGVSDWYTYRRTEYQKCLDTIKPLAARQVPSWRWQNCVISIENDKYNRDQMMNNLDALKKTEYTSEKDLNQRLAEYPIHLSTLVEVRSEACTAGPNRTACLQQVENWRQAALSRLERVKIIGEYKAILPKIHQALDADTEISTEGEQHLSDLAHTVDQIFKGAQ